mgnify:CR=1 FL=1
MKIMGEDDFRGYGANVLKVFEERAAEAGIRPPALLIVGEVVSLADRLAWFSPSGAALQGA